MIMKFKKFSSVILSAALLSSAALYYTAAITAAENTSTTIWTEVPITETDNITLVSYGNFNLRNIIAETDFVFSGTVIDRKEYEVQWTDENNEIWGPYSRSVIEVRINKEYYGSSPVSGDTIRIYNPDSLCKNISGSFRINDDQEYVFVTRFLDEEFTAEKNENNPYDKFEQEKYADVYISNSRDDIMPVINDTVACCNKYFLWNKELLDKAVSNDYVTADISLMNSESVLSLNRTDFDKAVSSLFETSVSADLGDADSDGAVNSADASSVLKEYADIATGGSGAFTLEQLLASDVNNDIAVDSSDASAILSYYAYVSTGGKDLFEDFLNH